MITGNEPAQATDFLNNQTGNVEFSQGLTIRQHFAAMAMQGMLSACRGYDTNGSDNLAFCAVRQADALIKKLNENPAVTGLNDITTNKTQNYGN